MKKFITIILALTLTAVGYTHDAGHVFPAEKEGLRKILSPKFALTSLPKEREEDFYRVLFLFAETRRPDELVEAVDFSSDSEARLYFSSDAHGGAASLKKTNERWTMEKSYFM